MNFKKIINAMENLNSLHDRVNEKFSSNSKGHQIYKGCLQQDEQEDLRIYGRTHKDTIRKFKSLQQRKSCDFTNVTHKVIPSKQFDWQQIKDSHFEKFTGHRSKTAHIKKFSKQRKERKSSQCFLTAQNILYKQQKSKYIDSKYNTVSLINNKPQVINKSRQIKRQSIVNFKKQFNKSFTTNIEISKRIHSATLHVLRPKKFIMGPCNSKENHHVSHKVNNFFNLTQQDNIEAKNQLKNIKDSQYEYTLNKINQHLSNQKNKNRNFGLIFGRQKQQERYSRIIGKLTNEIKCILLCGKKLDLYQTQCTQQEITNNLKKLLKQQKMIHLYLLEEDQVIYDELVLSVNWSKNSLQNSIQLMKFLYKRFACFEDKNLATKAELVSNVEKFFSNLAPLPSKFSTFLRSIDDKNISILNFRQNIREIKNIKILLTDVMRHMEIQDLEQHQKATKLKNDLKGKFYFYICFFVLWDQFLFQCDHNFDRQHNFFVKFAMDKPRRPSFSKRIQMNETLPGTPHHKPTCISGPFSSAESAQQVLNWFVKKGIKTMVDPEDLQITQLNKKKQDISEGRDKVEIPSTLLQRRALKRNLTLKV